ncbi:MAG: thioredoxin family protein [Candidatus Nanoarchaeia archaeon]|jgi:thioredoxin 1
MKKLIALMLVLLLAACFVSAFKLPTVSPYAQKNIMLKANVLNFDKIQPRIRLPRCYKELAPENYWETIRNSEKPVVVKFYSQLCEPCKKMAPYYEQACWEYRGRADFYALDIFQNLDFYYTFGLYHVPAILFYNGGSETSRVTEITPEWDFIKNAIEQFLASI